MSIIECMKKDDFIIINFKIPEEAPRMGFLWIIAKPTKTKNK